MHHRVSRQAFIAGFSALLLGLMLAGSPLFSRAAALSAPCGAAGGTPAAAGSPIAAAAVAPVPAQPTEQNPVGDIPDNQAFVRYASSTGGYSIEMPEGWARKENGSSVSFSDKLHEFSVDIQCAPSAPTVNSVNTAEAAALSQSIEAFTLVDVAAVTLPAGPAIQIHYQANSKPDDVTGKQHRLDVDRYEIFKDGKLAVITLAAPAGSDNVDVSKQVSSSFQWTS